ncbi:MAG: hypothetical protein B6I20_14650 [Bacteroidetes bacterium 4572_117]|nr:MAG: hypothetical protein B6I20_14650 [Bacteroidetes bacterium 4572_117]
MYVRNRKKCNFVKTIQKILRNYDLGRLKTYALLTNGFANKNYRIETEKGVFLYRICKQLSLKGVQNEIKFLHLLKQANFPAAYPIKKNDGTYLNHADNNPIIIYDFIEGGIPELNHKTVGEIGKAVAKLNIIEGWESFQKSNFINIDGAIKLTDKFVKAKYQYPDIFNDFTEAISYLKDKITNDLPRGFIHADVFPDNTIFAGDKLMALIDFECFCVDNLLFDIAMAINGFCFENNRLNIDLATSLLDTYSTVRPLTKNEKKHLPNYILWAAVGMASWHLQNDMLNNKTDKQTARARELLDRYKGIKKLGITF